MTPAEFERYKRAEEKARQQAERAAGAREQLLSRLKQEHGCNSVEEAQQLRKKLQKECDRLEQEVERVRAEIDKDYADKLGG